MARLTHGPSSRGIGLIEALLAMLALTVALAALLQLQALMRDSAEHDRLRLAALARVQSLHEGLRLGDPALADLPDEDGLDLQTEDLASDLPDLRQRLSVVRWPARRGWPARIELATLLPANPTETDRLAAAVLLERAPARQDDNGRAQPMPRHPLIPEGAIRLGDGRSAWQPRPDLPAVWLIDEADGTVLAQCGGLSTRADRITQAHDCVAVGGLLIGGVVRFSTDSDQPGTAEAEWALSAALPLDMVMQPASPAAAAPTADCVQDGPNQLPIAGTPHPPGVVRYLCVVAGSGSPPRWSGRLDLVPQGWSIGAADSVPPALPVRRVCRYSADHDRNGRIDNTEHPPVYIDVDGPLGDQNFLVVRGSATCPRDRSVDLTGSPGMSWLDNSTQPHQPP